MDAVMSKGTAKKAPKKAPKKAADKVPKTSSRADSIVTARVPTEIKEQGNKVLKKIGSTPTELINAAYQYVLEHGELPTTSPSLEDLRNRRRVLTPEQKEKLRKRLKETTLKAPASWSDKTYKELREEAMRERYPEYFEKEA